MGTRESRPASAFPSTRASEIVLIAYEAAENSDLWPVVFRSIGDLLDASAVTMVLRGFGPTRYVNCDAPEGFERMNPVHAFAAKALSRRGFVTALLGEEVVEDWTELPAELHHPGSIVVYCANPDRIEPGAIRAMRLLLPHLFRALKLYFGIEGLVQERDDFAACMDALLPGVLIVTGTGDVVYANRAAKQALSGESALVLESDYLRARSTADQSILRELLSAAAEPGERGLVPWRMSCSYLVFVRGLGNGRAVVFLENDGFVPLEPELLAEAFDLTAAESKVTARFVEGATTAEIASELGLSRHTVRSHLKRIQDKTGTKRQVALLRKILAALPRAQSED